MSSILHSLSPNATTSISNPDNLHFPEPSPDDIDDLLLHSRYGQLDPVRSFAHNFGVQALADARDDRGNNVLHMCAANGHVEILSYILSLPSLPPSLLKSGNESGNTPLHWACLNAQLSCAKLLVNFNPPPPAAADLPPSSGQAQTTPPTQGLGAALISVRNNAGHTPLGEAERNGWDEGAQWLVSVMHLQPASGPEVAGEAEMDVLDERLPKNEDTRDPTTGEDGGGAKEKEKEGGKDTIPQAAPAETRVRTDLARLRLSDEDGSEPSS